MRRMLPLLLALLLLFGGCAARDPIAPMLSPTEPDTIVPAPEDPAVAPRERQVTLWFRFGSEPLLAPETRTLTLSPAAPFEMTLLQALANGPAAASTELGGLFPPGTRVVATHLEGRTLFVTLSTQIMNDFADEPAQWASDPRWADEIPRRRLLAMQAIAATVTENCEVDRVVILVEHTGSGGSSLRLKARYYRDGADGSELAAPLVREESVLLTPANTCGIILECWHRRDWPRLYRYVARTDPATGEPRPDQDAFCLQMDALPHLTGYAAGTGSVSPDGQTAVFPVTLTLLIDGQSCQSTGVIRLQRERGLWRVGVSQLDGKEGDLQ